MNGVTNRVEMGALTSNRAVSPKDVARSAAYPANAQQDNTNEAHNDRFSFPATMSSMNSMDMQDNKVTVPAACAAAANDAPTLPPELWARILEYSVFSDISLLAMHSTFIHNNVLPLIRSLYFDNKVKVSEDLLAILGGMDFGAVEEIVLDNIISIISIDGAFDIVPGTYEIGDVVPCLTHFPVLKHVFLGKGECEATRDILDRLDLTPSDEGGYVYKSHAGKIPPSHPHEPMNMFISYRYEALLRDIACGYRDDVLPKSMVVHGLPQFHVMWCNDGLDYMEDEWSSFELICRFFPLSQVASFEMNRRHYFPHDFGSFGQRITVLLDRKDGKEFVVENLSRIVHRLLEDGFIRCARDPFERNTRGSLFTFYDSAWSAMQLLKDTLGCDLSGIRVRKPGHKVTRMTFERLSSVGFDISEDDFAMVLSDNGLWLEDDDEA